MEKKLNIIKKVVDNPAYKGIADGIDNAFYITSALSSLGHVTGKCKNEPVANLGKEVEKSCSKAVLWTAIGTLACAGIEALASITNKAE